MAYLNLYDRILRNAKKIYLCTWNAKNMKKIKYILKELSGGQELTMKQRGIFMWWSLSLTFAVIFAECLWLCFLMVASFGIATHYLKQVSIPDDDSAEV